MTPLMNLSEAKAKTFEILLEEGVGTNSTSSFVSWSGIVPVTAKIEDSEYEGVVTKLTQGIRPQSEPEPLEKKSSVTYVSADPALIPKLHPARFHSILLEQWEGTVLRVRGQEIEVSLRSLTDDPDNEEVGTLSFDDISNPDKSLVEPGAVFYWSISYRTDRSGQKTLASTVQFRRLPIWTRAEIARAKLASEQFDKIFGD